MGEISEMVLEGGMCRVCGEYLEGGDGYARTCQACSTSDYYKDLKQISEIIHRSVRSQ